MAKEEITRNEQFLLLTQCFEKLSTADASKCVYMWERVKPETKFCRGIKMYHLTFSHIQKICNRQTLKTLTQKYLYKWKFNYWIKLQILLQKKKLLIMSNFTFCHNVFKSRQIVSACGKWLMFSLPEQIHQSSFHHYCTASTSQPWSYRCFQIQPGNKII